MTNLSAITNGIRPEFLHRAAGVVAILAVSLVLPVSAAGPTADPVQFSIDGVGSGTFANATLGKKRGATASDASDADHPCITLAGGSRDNGPELLAWMKSNSAGGALATLPDATLTVPANHERLKPGIYRLDNVTIGKFRLKADRDLTNPRLEGADVRCDALQPPP